MIKTPPIEAIVTRAKAAAYLAIKRNEALGIPSIVYDAASKKVKELSSINMVLPCFQTTDTTKTIYEFERPTIVVFAGPNCSGKSTIGDLLRPFSLHYINADEIKKAIKCDDLKAAQLAQEQREKYLSEQQGFCFETVMSTSRNLELLQRAKAAGYFVLCYYVLTADPEINVRRVKGRVMAGGHGVPEQKIMERCHKALSLLSEVANCADAIYVIDNSTAEPEIIFSKINGVRNKYKNSLWDEKDFNRLKL